MPNKLTKKLFDIQSENISLTKDWENPHYHSKFVTLDNLVSTLSPFWKTHWLLVHHFVDMWELVTTVTDVESWESISSRILLSSTDPQKKWGEISYFKRYNIGAIFNTITDDDDDGNFASWKTAPQSVQTPTPSTYTAKSQYTATYAAPAGKVPFANTPDATTWMTEKQVDTLFDKMISGHEPLANNVTNLIGGLRKSGKGISKKLAAYIEAQWIKRIEDIAFPWVSSTPLTTKDWVEVPF